MGKSNTPNGLQGSQELLSRMPRGGLTLLATKYGVSSQYIRLIVKGSIKNRPGIVADAIHLAEFAEESDAIMQSVI